MKDWPTIHTVGKSTSSANSVKMTYVPAFVSRLRQTSDALLCMAVD